MNTLLDVLVFLHLLGMAAIIGGFAAVATDVRPNPAMVWGARAQLITGMLLMFLFQSQDWTIDTAFLIVKFVIALVVTGLLEVASAKWSQGDKKPVLVQAAAALAVVNVAVATFWH